MKESEFYAKLRSRLPGMPVRIENAISSGLPDIALFFEGRTYWIELKVGTMRPLFRPAQRVMHTRMRAQGIVSICLFLCGMDDVVEVHFLPGNSYTFNRGYLTLQDLPHKVIPLSRLSCDEISSVLRESVVVM